MRLYFYGVIYMGLNKGYLTAKTDKASDEVYTPAYAIKPLLKYLEEYSHPEYMTTIWCFFDKNDREYVKIFRANISFDRIRRLAGTK